jgi:hypothetical protein
MIIVYSDADTVFKSLNATDFPKLGVTWISSAADDHEPLIERVIGVLRERFRAIYFALGYSLPPHLFLHAFEHPQLYGQHQDRHHDSY